MPTTMTDHTDEDPTTSPPSQRQPTSTIAVGTPTTTTTTDVTPSSESNSHMDSSSHDDVSTSSNDNNHIQSSGVKLRSVPIPQPLLLKNRASRSSFSSGDDGGEALTNSSHSQTNNTKHILANKTLATTPTASTTKSTAFGINTSMPTSPTRSIGDNKEGNPTLPAYINTSYRKPYLGDGDGNSGTSPGSDTGGPSSTHVSTGSPSSVISNSNLLLSDSSTPPAPAPHQTSSSGSFSPRYSSPPAGSGGKYMVKSKRASWIDGSASHTPPQHPQPQQIPSSPTTGPSVLPIGGYSPATLTTMPIMTAQMDHHRQVAATPRKRTTSISSNKSSVGTVSDQQEIQGAIPGHKSGSLSQLREQQQRSSAAAAAAAAAASASTSSSGNTTLIPTSPSSPSGGRHRIPVPDQEPSSILSAPSDQQQKQRQGSLDSYLDGNTADMEDGVEDGNNYHTTGGRRSSSGMSYRPSPHERHSSVSSIVTESTSDEYYYSPGSSPQAMQSPLNVSPFQSAVVTDKGKTKLTSSSSTSSSPSRFNAPHEVLASGMPNTEHHQQAIRRSSMTMLRNIPSSELANIVSGNSPNPIIDVPPPTLSPLASPEVTTAATTTTSSPTFTTTTTNIDPSVTSTLAYQHSLQTFLRRQLSSKQRKPRRSRSSSNGTPMEPPLMPSESSSSSTLSYGLDADKDIVEIDLDDGGGGGQPSSKLTPASDTSRRSSSQQHRESMKSPLYPAMLLDGASSQTSDGQQNHLLLPTHSQQQQIMAADTKAPSGFITSAPELPRWDDDTAIDYFHTANNSMGQHGTDGQRNFQPLVRSSSLSSMRNRMGSDEDYGRRLFMSRSAKIRRWCTLKFENQDGYRRSSSSSLSRRRRQQRRQSSGVVSSSSSSNSTATHYTSRRNSESSHWHSGAPSPLGPRSPEARISRRLTKDGSRMPTITVTAHEDRSSSEDNTAEQDTPNHAGNQGIATTGQLINAIPWVDWIEEYKVLKASEMRRRSSEMHSPLQTPSAVDTTRQTLAKQQQLNTGDSILVQNVLSNWWNNVKTNAEHYSLSKRVVYFRRRGGHGTETDRLQSRAQHDTVEGDRRTSAFEPSAPTKTQLGHRRHRPALSLDFHDLGRISFQGEFKGDNNSIQQDGGSGSSSLRRYSTLPSRTKQSASTETTGESDTIAPSHHGIDPTPEAPPPSVATASSYHGSTQSSAVDSPSVSLNSLASTPGGIQKTNKILQPPLTNHSILQHSNNKNRQQAYVKPHIPALPISPTYTRAIQRLSATAAHPIERIGYRFYNVGNRMGAFGNILDRTKPTSPSHLKEESYRSNDSDERSYETEDDEDDDDDNHSTQVQHTIKSRLQYAKEACDCELREIIDGLNEYVERGLQYVEDAHGYIEKDDISDHDEMDYVPDAVDTLPPLITPAQDIPIVSAPPSPSHTGEHQRIRHGLLETGLHDIEEEITLDGDQQQQEQEGNNNLVTLISEDSYLPTPFILTLQELIIMAQHVMDTSLDAILECPGTCAEIVFKIQSVGMQWDTHPEWPCREWYVRLLLSVAALNRVLEWWEAERGFWLQAWNSNTPTSSSSILPTPTSTTAATSDTEDTATGLPPTTRKSSLAFNHRLHHDRQPQHLLQQNHVNDIRRQLDGSRDDTDLSSPHQLGVYQDILQQAANNSQNSTILLELSLGTTTVQYVSPIWSDVIGTNPSQVIHKNISKFVSSDAQNVFKMATEKLLADDSQTVEVQFGLISADGSSLEMDGKGMLMYDRVTGEASHTMWVIKPMSTRLWMDRALTPVNAVDQQQQHTSATAIPTPAGDEMSDQTMNPYLRHRSMSLPAIETQALQNNNTLMGSSEVSSLSFDKLMSLPPAVCRVCERWVVAAFFEQHSELCVEIHQSEMDVTMCNDNLRDLKHHIQELRDQTNQELEDYGNQTPEKRKEMDREHMDNIKAAREQDEEDSIFGFELPLEEAPNTMESKQAELEIYEDLLDALDVAIGIGMPGETDDKLSSSSSSSTSSDNDDKTTLRSLQSPRSKHRMVQVIYWRPPASDDPNITALIREVEEVSRGKVSAVNRMRDRLEYNERTRTDFQKATQQETGWTEFVPRKDDLAESNTDTKNDEDKDITAEASENIISTPSEPTNTETPANSQSKEDISPPASEPSSARCGPVKKSILSRIKSWKSKGASKLARRSRAYSRKWATAIEPFTTPANMSIVEMETIDTPLGSPGLRLSRTPSRHEASANNSDRSTSIAPSSSSTSISTTKPSATSTTAAGTPTGQSLSTQQHHEGKSPLSPLQASIPSTRATTPSIKDFDIIKPISKGAFGSVFLAKKRTTGDYYAIKFLKKSDMIAKNQVTNVKAERMILMTQTDSPFVTKLYYTFQSKDYLYLVMEYLNGGDCSALVKVLGHLPEDWARNYLAEVTLGLEYLQNKNIIHRDLKPDNLLIDHNGHLKLTDFGLSRIGFLDRRVQDELATHSPSYGNSTRKPIEPQTNPSTTTTTHDSQGGNSKEKNPDEPSSPMPSPTGTPPQSPETGLVDNGGPRSEPAAQQGDGIYRHSYFSLLFNRRRDSSTSLASDDRNSNNSDHSSSNKICIPMSDSMMDESGSISKSRSSGFPSATKSTPPAHRRPTTGLGNVIDASSPARSSTSGYRHRGNLKDTSIKHAVGTPDYLAPESILGTGQDSMVDWWALGVICYEFLYGYPPFHAESPDKVFENILSRRIDWHENEVEVSSEARDFMEQLMTLDPAKRLGSQGAQSVRAHPFFKDIQWDTLMLDQPSFIPQPEDMEDTDYFDDRGAIMMIPSSSSSSSSSTEPTSKVAIGQEKKVAEDKLQLDASAKAKVDLANAIIQEQHPTAVPEPSSSGPSSSSKSGKDNKKRCSQQTEQRRKSSTTSTTKEETVDQNEGADFGTFLYKNLPVLEKANEDTIRKIRHDSSAIRDLSPSGSSSSNTGNGSVSNSNLGDSMDSGIQNRRQSAFPPKPLQLPPSSSSLDTASGPGTPKASSSTHSGLHPLSSQSTKLDSRRSVDVQHHHSDPMAGTTGPSVITPPPLPSTPGSQHQRSRSLSTPDCRMPIPPGPNLISPAKPSPSIGSNSTMGIITPSIPPTPKQQPGTPLAPLPAPSTSSTSHTSPLAPREGTEPLIVNRKRISTARPLGFLVVDDNPISCKILETILLMLNHQCVIVRNGAQAIRSAMSDVKYDIIFMDIRMPIIDGETAARMIKSTNNVNRETPIIAVTAYEQTVQLAGAFDEILCKPVTKNIISQCIDQFCQGGKATKVLPISSSKPIGADPARNSGG